MMGLAQQAVARALNSLPEGLLIAGGAWLLLRVMGRENARTRFAIWLVALIGVAALPLVGGFAPAAAGAAAHPEWILPGIWATAFLIFWAVAGAVALARVGVGIVQVRRLCRSCGEVAEGELDAELWAAIDGAGRRVRVLASEKARVPAAVGFRRPAIVLPEWALAELSTAELKPILIHELAHLRRRDDWTNLLQKAVRAALFFHPAVWWIDARLSLERELACDDAVMAATGNPRAYAGCLIEMLERGCARRGWTMAQAAMARARDASMRIARILHDGAPRSTRVGRAAMGMATSVALGCAGLVVFAPHLVGFAPEHGALTAGVSLAQAGGGDLGPGPAAVVPAAFYLQEQHRARPKAAARERKLPRRPAEVRGLVAARRNEVPVVMARLNTDRPPRAEGENEREQMSHAADGPTLLLYRAKEAAAKAEAAGDFRPAAAEVVGRTDTGQRKMGQGSMGVQIQMVQVIEQVSERDERQVRNVQILRLVLIVPAQGERAQSI